MREALYVFQVGISLETGIHPQWRLHLVAPLYKQGHSDTSELPFSPSHFFSEK